MRAYLRQQARERVSVVQLLRRPQRRLALAVNLLLVLALGVGFLVGVQRGKDLGHLTQVPTPSASQACRGEASP